MVLELAGRGIAAEQERPVSIYYSGHLVGKYHLDLLVDERVIVELKTVDDLARLHYAQLRSYLKAMGLRIGLLVNFATAKADFRRVEIS